MDSHILLPYASTTVAAAAAYFLFQRLRTQNKLPPGPAKYPIVGNLLSMPGPSDCDAFLELGKQYGTDILHFGGLGHNIFVLNSYEDAQELFEKRSGIYSGRPHSVMFSELTGWGFQFAIWPYADKWRAARKTFTRHFNVPEIYLPRETVYIHRLLQQLLQDPDSFFSYVRHVPACATVDMTYGFKIETASNPYLKAIEEGVDSSVDTISSTWLVDLIPVLKHLPTWFPGATFHRAAIEAKAHCKTVLETPFAATKEYMKTGDYEHSFVTDCFEETPLSERTPEWEEFIKVIAGQVFAAGSDTSASSLGTFFLAMVMHPEVQSKAQEELDSVLQGRLPDHIDMASLPYLNAIVWEVFRWKPVVPAGVPHLNILDDIYEGLHIPAGSTLIPNQKAMLFNEQDFPDAQKFKPERYLKDGQLDLSVRSPMDIAFGFGRRICPGRHIAQSMVLLTAASVLSLFDITKKIDNSGQIIEPSGEYVEAIVSKPHPFPCTIKPRSEAAVALIQSLEEI